MQKKSRTCEKFPLFTLNILNTEGKIWLNPDYQRLSVWRPAQEQLFIDSLLNNFDVPKLYFREIAKNNYEFEVVDGQQRLTTISRFFADKFALQQDADPINGHPTAGLTFHELHTDLQRSLYSVSLDIVILNSAYSDEDIEDMFIRLQNGTPLNAAEKRRAIAGNARRVVQYLAEHPVFNLCEFKNSRFSHEDVAAKLLHLAIAGEPTDTRQATIKKMYEDHPDITNTHVAVLKLVKAFNFIKRAFRDKPTPDFKKYALLSISYAVTELLETYTLSKFPDEFADAYLDFDYRRKENEKIPLDENQEPRLAAYTDAARADSIPALEFRNEMIKEAILGWIPNLALKDQTRDFSPEQRRAIYQRDQGICAVCKQTCDPKDFHADHIKAHARGGETKLANGQLLCPSCNLKKGDRQIPLTMAA